MLLERTSFSPPPPLPLSPMAQSNFPTLSNAVATAAQQLALFPNLPVMNFGEQLQQLQQSQQQMQQTQQEMQQTQQQMQQTQQQMQQQLQQSQQQLQQTMLQTQQTLQQMQHKLQHIRRDFSRT